MYSLHAVSQAYFLSNFQLTMQCITISYIINIYFNTTFFIIKLVTHNLIRFCNTYFFKTSFSFEEINSNERFTRHDIE